MGYRLDDWWQDHFQKKFKSVNELVDALHSHKDDQSERFVRQLALRLLRGLEDSCTQSICHMLLEDDIQDVCVITSLMSETTVTGYLPRGWELKKVSEEE